MEEAKIVSEDPEVMSGEIVFAGTRIEVKTLVDHLKATPSTSFWTTSRPSRASRPKATSTRPLKPSDKKPNAFPTCRDGKRCSAKTK